MEDYLVNQLPEADALPDGFCETTSETSTVSIAPEFDKKSLSEGSISYHTNGSFEGDTVTKEPVTCLGASQGNLETGKVCEGNDTGNSSSDDKREKTEKARTFPVQLSGTGHFSKMSDGRMVADTEKIYIDGESSLSNCFCRVDDSSASDSTFCGDVLESSKNTDEKQATSGSAKFSGTENVAVECHPNERNEQNCSNSIEPAKQEKASEAKSKKAKGMAKMKKELAYSQIILERDTALLELKKNVSVRERLESLCRELQRQNKFLMDECKKISEEGQQKRLELSTKFEDAIKNVSNKLDEQRDERLSQLKENEMLRGNLKLFCEKYEAREQQLMQELKKKELELEIAEVKLRQQQDVIKQEQGRSHQYAEQISQLLETEKNLRLQLAADGEKFQQFQETLAKSNEAFESFKKEMEKMAKAIKELNKENSFLKSKCEKTDVSLIELVDEREKLKKQLEKTKNQKEKLESLCRKLQEQRKQQDNINFVSKGDVDDPEILEESGRDA
eukprot:TRINITY_DN11871_c0_g1_i1.p1 TRINITY_DN11871_c0_g1~~TRINITY_DN11871_c0_g1_i1.p1  ORF type:complete len:505 (-),score=164.88 TRINITY_DN11871_c0_g1_i1:264-1778(-)